MDKLSEKRLKEFTKRADKLIFSTKDKDYNDDKYDILDMFPKGWASSHTFINKHFNRLDVLLSNNRKPKNESIEDNFMDLFNYVRMAYVEYVENREK